MSLFLKWGHLLRQIVLNNPASYPMSKSQKQRRRKGSSFKLETFLINYGLQTAGILFIVGGLAYLMTSNFNFHFLSEFWHSFINSTSGESSVPEHTRTTSSGYLSLLLYLPGILLLGFTHFMRGNNASIKKILVSLAFIWLIWSVGKVLLDIRNHHIELNYYLLLSSFGVIQAVVTSISIAGKNRFALNWSVIYFFASVFFIRLIYGVLLPNILILVIVQLAVSLACYILKWRSPFILLMTLSAFYISYYFVKSVILPVDAASTLTYMLPAVLVWFILSATGFGILKPESHSKPITFAWNYLPYATLAVAIGLVLGYYFKAGICYPALIYYSIAVIALALITILNKKYTFITYPDPFYLSVTIFSAFLIPQLFYSDFFLILSACLAVALLINVRLTGLKINYQLSVGLLFISLGLYLAQWTFKIIPAFVTQATAGTPYFLQLVVPGLLLFALSGFYLKLFSRLLEDYSFSHREAKKYTNAVRLGYTVILYLTLFLVLDFLLIQLIPGYRINFIEWGLYTYSFLYFIITSQNPKSKTKLLYSFIFVLPAVILYPAVIHPETIHFRTLFLAGETLAILPFIMHYFCLGVLILILLTMNRRLGQHYPKNRFILNLRILLGVISLCFILLAEYDHLLLLSVSGLSSRPAYEILQYNKFIPYSLILLLVSVVLLVFSLIRYTRFLRRLSMIMILAVLLKVLFIDITILPAHTGIILLISLGAILLALSFLIPRFRKQSTASKSG